MFSGVTNVKEIRSIAEVFSEDGDSGEFDSLYWTYWFSGSGYFTRISCPVSRYKLNQAVYLFMA